METISNLVNTATTTVSNAIYGAEPAKATNETGGKEPVSGQTGKGTVDEPYDQGNSESALEKNTTSTTGTGIESSRVTEPSGSIQKPSDLLDAYNKEAGDSTTSTTSTSTDIKPTRELEPTGSIQKPDDLISAYNKEAGSSTSTTTGSGPTTTAITDKAGATLPTTETSGKDTLWRGVDAYKDTSSTAPTSTGVTSIEPTSSSSFKDTSSTGPTSTGSTITGSEPTRVTSGDSTSGGPKGAVDAEPKNYSIGDLTTGKETPPKTVGDDSTKSTSNSTSKPGEAAVSPPDLSNTSPGSKPDYSADTHQPSHATAGLVGEKAGHGGPHSAQANDRAGQSSSISPSGDDDEKSGKLHGLKDKLKNKLHIGH